MYSEQGKCLPLNSDITEENDRYPRLEIAAERTMLIMNITKM